MTDGIFGDFFDFDNNGELDTFEESAEVAFLANLIDETEKELSDDFDDDFDNDLDDDFGDFDSSDDF